MKAVFDSVESKVSVLKKAKNLREKEEGGHARNLWQMSDYSKADVEGIKSELQTVDWQKLLCDTDA